MSLFTSTSTVPAFEKHTYVGNSKFYGDRIDHSGAQATPVPTPPDAQNLASRNESQGLFSRLKDCIVQPIEAFKESAAYSFIRNMLGLGKASSELMYQVQVGSAIANFRHLAGLNDITGDNFKKEFPTLTTNSGALRAFTAGLNGLAQQTHSKSLEGTATEFKERPVGGVALSKWGDSNNTDVVDFLDKATPAKMQSMVAELKHVAHDALTRIPVTELLADLATKKPDLGLLVSALVAIDLSGADQGERKEFCANQFKEQLKGIESKQAKSMLKHLEGAFGQRARGLMEFASAHLEDKAALPERLSGLLASLVDGLREKLKVLDGKPSDVSHINGFDQVTRDEKLILRLMGVKES
ncbi:hypothetical protein RBU55_18355 [Pseudomonas chlororaphis subsp. aurantiaca]|uniref:hypothetical protein n=1 Tax=Pseudomonas chlororaphis TaxID=587753 RepID=UPI0027DC8949|nr:hypothetical protein [Pseudomonas chlororaphis]WMI97529.1 hypothetical protein RBU55_18355 [Pseudomonas chlororaphis subsp. aurantiaca]